MVSSILPNNQWKNSTLLLWYLKSNCVCSFFGRIEDTKKTLWNYLTFSRIPFWFRNNSVTSVLKFCDFESIRSRFFLKKSVKDKYFLDMTFTDIHWHGSITKCLNLTFNVNFRHQTSWIFLNSFYWKISVKANLYCKNSKFLGIVFKVS